MRAIVVYLPVPHQGYLSFLQRHFPADVFLLNATSISFFDEKIGDQLNRDMRAVNTVYIRKMLKSIYLRVNVEIFMNIEQLKEYSEIIMPDEDISHIFQKQVPWAHVRFDTKFLRWDWSNSTKQHEVVGSFPVSSNLEDRQIMAMARAHAGNSSDVWRHVGAAIKIPRKKKLLLTAHNEHMPDPSAPYVNGDPRLSLNPGEHPEICTAIHAEASLIAQAAKEGIRLDGLSIYVTTFPCPVCAKSIKKAGIKKVFFESGYSVLDAAEILVKADIEIFQVK